MFDYKITLSQNVHIDVYPNVLIVFAGIFEYQSGFAHAAGA